ncbi:MAG: serine/threonine-protein phosphatase, partial [Gemmataceae bacterium]|nr:serine/threonine-protein phosphatase [Gemmataceae bacterium]
NDVFQMDRQDGKYFTIFYGVYRPADRTLRFCNAGHPPGLLWDGTTVHDLVADGPAVGMVPELPYDTHTIAVPVGSTLLLYSDGVFEIETGDGQMWSLEDFMTHIRGQFGPEPMIDRHLAHARELNQTETLGDDFSMVEARFPG